MKTPTESPIDEGQRLLMEDDSSGSGAWTLVLAHGAGEGMESPFMESVARLTAARGLRVVRFEFPYMAEMGRTGRRRPPDPASRLTATWHRVLNWLIDRRAVVPRRLLIGGKSMGGRMASLVALERETAGLVCLGFPFHPPGKAERTRVAHLARLPVPTLICQGTRDPFGRPEEVAAYRLSPSVQVHWIEGGDHGFRPTRASGRTWEENLAEAADAIAALRRRIERGARSRLPRGHGGPAA